MILALSAAATAFSSRPARAEEVYSLEPHGLMQFDYRGVWQQGQSLPTESGVFIPRARASVDGTIYMPGLGFRAELDAGFGSVKPLDLYMAYQRGAWRVRAGQFRVPYSRDWMIPDANLVFPERSIATDAFRYDYDIGIMVALETSHVDAALGAFNGAGKNVIGNDNVDPLFVARVSGHFGPAWNHSEGDIELTRPPSLSFGTAATLDYVPVPVAYGFTSGQPIPASSITARDTDMNGRVDGVRVFELEGDLTLHWRGLAFESEVYFRHESWNDIGSLQPATAQFVPKPSFGGFFAQVIWAFLRGHVETGARFSYTDVSPLSIDGRALPASTCVGVSGQSFTCFLPFTDRRTELTAAAVYHLFGHGAQLSASYGLLSWHTDQEYLLPYAREQRLIGQLQLAF